MKKELQKLGYKFRDHGDINNLEYAFVSGTVRVSGNSAMGRTRYTYSQEWNLKIKNLNIATLVEQINGIYKVDSDDGVYPQSKPVNGNYYLNDYTISYSLLEDGYLIKLNFI